MEYRREIDGLRAVAVLQVILYHAGFQVFKGGFIGVDIFFVISGYLITTIVVSDLDQGKFSLLSFYERRARRILPVLFFIILCCLPFAWLWLSPKQLQELCQSLLAVTLFSSNMFFWKKSGYFDTAAEVKPFLHTWSLSVEEQYYLFFPLFLMLMWKMHKRLIPAAVILGAGISLITAQCGSYHHRQATFYLLPTRGWEIAVGALIALFLYQKEAIAPNKATRELLSFLGLILIISSVFLIDKDSPFPLFCLFPIVGVSFVLLFSTSKTVVGRLLGTKPLVAIGLISYSAYLWHQPLFAFARYRNLEEVSASSLVTISIITMILAYFSWRYIEMPFRDRGIVSQRFIFRLAVAASGCIAFVGICGHIGNGYPNRFDFIYNKLVSPACGDVDSGGKSEAIFDEKRLTSNPLLLIGDTSTRPTIAVIGDSHAYVLTKSLSILLKAQHKSALVYARSGNLPFPEVNNNVRPINRDHMGYAYKSIVNNKDITTVILAARWALYLKDVTITDDFSADASSKENVQVFNRGLRRAMDLLCKRGIKTVIIGDVPEYEVSVPEYLAKSYLFNGTTRPSLPLRYQITRSKYESRAQEALEAFKSPDVNSRAQYIDSYYLMSTGATSEYIDQDYNVFYADNEHLSFRGSKIIADELAKHL